MNPLFKNDRQGEYPDSWYVASTDIPEPRRALAGSERADVCVIGAGYTGLSAALFLARAGLKVIVLEAHRAAFGASGRNGGQVGSGFRHDQQWLEAKMGLETARALWQMAQDAKAQVRDIVASHAPDARYTPGVAHGALSAKEARELRAGAEHMATTYGYTDVEVFDATEFHDLVRTRTYSGGILDNGAGHIHPLRYGLGLARAAEEAGAILYEHSAVTGVAHGTPARVKTDAGEVTADHVVFAGNGYLPSFEPKIAARVMPINSFIAATEPLGDRTAEVLSRDIAVADDKFVVNYFRMSEDGRFLFGGRESYTLGYPTDITTQLRARMLTLFPQLEGVRIDYAWGGTLGITMTRLPAVLRVAPNALSASGFSGHGVALSGFCGRVMAEAIIGQTGRFDILSALPTTVFPGGAAMRAPLLTLGMTWFSLRDRLGI